MYGVSTVSELLQPMRAAMIDAKCLICDGKLKLAETPGWFWCPECGVEFSKIVIPGPTLADRSELLVPILPPRSGEGPQSK